MLQWWISYKDSSRLWFTITHQKIKPKILTRELLRIFFHSLSRPFATHILLFVFWIQNESWLISVKLVCNIKCCCLCYKFLGDEISFPQNLVLFDFVSYFALFILYIPLFTSQQRCKMKERQPKMLMFLCRREKGCQM